MLLSQNSLEVAGFTLGMREAVITLIALVVVYMLVVLWRMRPLSMRLKKADNPADAGAEVATGATHGARGRNADAWRAPPGMAEEMVQSAVEQELAMLREEVDAMRGELAALRADMQHELAQVRATQSVSPLYGDAMQLAHAGYDPAAIAERCGIARAEAELVVALAKRQEC